MYMFGWSMFHGKHFPIHAHNSASHLRIRWFAPPNSRAATPPLWSGARSGRDSTGPRRGAQCPHHCTPSSKVLCRRNISSMHTQKGDDSVFTICVGPARGEASSAREQPTRGHRQRPRRKGACEATRQRCESKISPGQKTRTGRKKHGQRLHTHSLMTKPAPHTSAAGQYGVLPSISGAMYPVVPGTRQQHA